MKTRKLALTSIGLSIGLLGNMLFYGTNLTLIFDMIACYLMPFSLFSIYVILVSWNVILSLPSLIPAPYSLEASVIALTLTLYVLAYSLYIKFLTWLFLKPILQKRGVEAWLLQKQ